jgi:5'-nucleotidase
MAGQEHHVISAAPRRALVSILVAALLLVAAACSSTSNSASPSSSTSAATGSSAGAGPGTTANHPLRILVTNDDGFGAPGIDALVEALRKEPNVEVTVVAPAENQSGTGGKTTPGSLLVTDAKTQSGYPAKAVAGFPADSVQWALNGGIPNRPDLVVSGNNAGQNLGPLVDVSGTVGAARAGARAGIPAVAVSQGIAANPDFASGVGLVIDWLRAHRNDLAQTTAANAPAGVLNFNAPTCPAGTPIRGLKDEPAATDLAGRDYVNVNCASTTTDFKDDIDAFINGFATQSVVPVEPTSGG